MGTRPPSELDETAELAETPEVVDRLVANHREFLRFLERRVGDRALAEDILQDAFVRGLDRLGTLRNDESAIAWFYRVLRNAVTDHYRRRATRDRTLAAFESELEAEPAGELRDAVCRCVGELARTLQPDYAEALELIEVQGLPVKAFAERAGISASNAGVRIFRAREALRRRVARSCGTCAEHGCLDCSCGGPSRAG
ncbi:MAG: sigma-70 family RNA polymerase sigma factor [Gemmatimonadales bacterium]